MSKLDDWATAPSRKTTAVKKKAVFVRTSISWTADYPETINKLLLEAQQGTSDPTFNRSLVLRAAIRALEEMKTADRLKLMKKMQEARDGQG